MIEVDINRLEEAIEEAQAIVIGAGAGLSTAAGLVYIGDRFKNNFSDYIEKYKMKDMYTAGFYQFKTQEEKWAYWSRHINLNRYEAAPGKVYKNLLELVENKEYFVITTNVDHQFIKAGFPEEKLFMAQGDYGLFQCAKGCHGKLYDNYEMVKKMVSHQKNCRIPSELVPKCPVCGGDMAVNIRCDDYFVEDERWYESKEAYINFLEKNKNNKILFLELGVGMNTPGIIKYPFWRMTRNLEDSYYITINLDQGYAPPRIKEKSLVIKEDISEVLKKAVKDHRLKYLVDYLKAEDIRYSSMEVKKADRRAVLRALMNIRHPSPLSPEFLKVQDRFLQEEAEEKGIVAPGDMDENYGDRIALWQGDITRLNVDAIVNAANSRMLGCFVPGHKCIDNAIHSAAGLKLRNQCYEYMERKERESPGYEEPAGTVVVTKGYNLPAAYVFHTVGPIVEDVVTDKHRNLLASCYIKCLEKASSMGLATIAFCCISTGVFKFPNEEAAEIAASVVKEFLKKDKTIKKVIFNVYKDRDLMIYREILNKYN